MEETLNTAAVEEGAVETNDADFSAGWGEEENPATHPDASMDASAPSGGKPERADAPKAAEEAADEKTTDGHGGTGQPQARQAEETPSEPVVFQVKYMDEEKTVSAEEAPALIQKGMDYDRIRVKYDEAKPVIEFMSRYARQAGVSLGEYVDHLRIEEKKAAGMPEEDARRAVELDNREESIRREEEASARAARQEAESKAAAQAQRADIEAFAREYPDVNATDIPREVWDKVRSGESLLSAYTRYENEKLKVALSAANQARENADRSTGSLKSAGSDSVKRDPFDEGWDD